MKQLRQVSIDSWIPFVRHGIESETVGLCKTDTKEETLLNLNGISNQAEPILKRFSYRLKRRRTYYKYQNSIAFLLENANPSSRLRVKKEVLGRITAEEEADLIAQIKEEPIYKLIASCQKENGWLGNGFHGPNKDAGPYENQEVGTKWLAEKAVGKDDPVLKRAMDAFVTTELTDLCYRTKGKYFDEFRYAANGQNLIRSACIARAGYDDIIDIRPQIQLALDSFKRVLEVDSILDITRIKKVSGKEKRVFNDYEKWPCYIRADSIEQVVIAELQTIARFLDEEEDEFAAMLESKTNKDIATEQKIVESQLDTARARVKEIERLYERIYEDNVNGKVSDEWFMKLSHKYEVEMDETKKNILALREKLDSLAEKRQTKENFVKAVRSFMEMKTLTPVILRELIEKIEVYQIEGTGKNRTQRMVIHYRFVGCLQIPEWHRKRKVTLESRQGVAVNYLPTTA